MAKKVSVGRVTCGANFSGGGELVRDGEGDSNAGVYVDS